MWRCWKLKQVVVHRLDSMPYLNRLLEVEHCHQWNSLLDWGGRRKRARKRRREQGLLCGFGGHTIRNGASGSWCCLLGWNCSYKRVFSIPSKMSREIKNHPNLRFNSDINWRGISEPIVIRSPSGWSKDNDVAWRQSLFTLALPKPCLVSPATGHPRFVICNRIWARRPVSILMRMRLCAGPSFSSHQFVIASRQPLRPASTKRTR